jgi:hypothetical protein
VLEECSPIPAVWGQQAAPQNVPSIENRERRIKELRAPGGPYARLKRIMDLWSAVWAWPLDHAALLPSRSQWITALEEALDVERTATPGKAQVSIWPKADEDEVEEAPKTAANLWSVVEDACERLRPMHWELAFPEVFVKDGGFSLVVGNPPWIQLNWDESGVLSDLDPRIILDGLSASEVGKRRGSLLGTSTPAKAYLDEAGTMLGAQAFLSAIANYSLLQGVRINLYKCFLVQGWRTVAHDGSVALIHQDGLFDDPNGGKLRRAAYERIRLLLRFKNEFRLFADVHNLRPYCLSISMACDQARLVRKEWVMR